jgi:hypothetical protein
LETATTPDLVQKVVKEAIGRAGIEAAGRENDREQQEEERGELKTEEWL